jgi:hypothetical protein
MNIDLNVNKYHKNDLNEMFNIKNYNKKDLIEMFKLPNNYDKYLVELNESKLREEIVNNKKSNKETQLKMIHFLKEAKNILVDGITKPFQEVTNDIYHLQEGLKQTKLLEPQEYTIQVKPTQPYVESMPGDFYPGILNPLKRRVDTKNLNIDTRFRPNYYSEPSTNFSFPLPLSMNNILTMQLSSIELPTTFYTICSQLNNNFFKLTVTQNNNSESVIVEIPNGNYNYDGITTILNQYMLNLGWNFQYIYFTINITNNGLVQNTGSGQMVVGINSSYTDDDYPITFSLDFQCDKSGVPDYNIPLPLKFGWMLGFRNGIYENNDTYVSEGIADLSGTRYVYLAIDDYNNNVNNSFYSAFTSSILNKNILARISIQSSLFSISSQNNLNIVTTPRQYFGPINISKLHIQLLDEYGRIILLNNMDFSFCLTFQTVYDI